MRAEAFLRRDLKEKPHEEQLLLLSLLTLIAETWCAVCFQNARQECLLWYAEVTGPPLQALTWGLTLHSARAILPLLN